MASKNLQQDELKLKAHGRIPDTMTCSIANFGGLLASAFNDGMESLMKSKTELTKNNIYSAAAGHLSRLQMPSKEVLCVLQTHVPLTTRMQGTGRDVRDASNADPQKKGKRHNRKLPHEVRCFLLVFNISQDLSRSRQFFGSIVDITSDGNDSSVIEGQSKDERKMPAKPPPKRKAVIKKATSAKSTSTEDFFRAHTVHHVLGYMLNGSP